MDALSIILVALCLGALAFLGGRHRLGKSLPPVAFLGLGTLMGPFGLGLFQSDQIVALRPLALFCVAWIGIIIGTQADLSLWKRIGFRVPKLAIGLGAGSGLFAGLPIFLVLLMAGTSWTLALAAAMVMAAAGSVSAITHIRSSRFKSLAMSCSGLDDFACLLLAALPFCLLSPEGIAHDLGRIGRDLGLIALAGVALGLALVLLVSARAHLDERLTICLGIVAMLAGVASDLGLAPFVVAGLAGMVLINTRFPAKEKIYQVFVDAERPIGLFVLLYAGAMITRISLFGLALGFLWAANRLLGRLLVVKWMGAPSSLAEQTFSVGAAAPVVVVAFELLTSAPTDGLLLQAVLCGWIITETAVLAFETRRRFLEAQRA